MNSRRLIAVKTCDVLIPAFIRNSLVCNLSGDSSESWPPNLITIGLSWLLLAGHTERECLRVGNRLPLDYVAVFARALVAHSGRVDPTTNSGRVDPITKRRLSQSRH